MIVSTLALLLAGQAAPPDSPEQVVRAMFAAFDRHDAPAMARLYADHARLNSSDFCATRGRGDVERTYNGLFAAYPDVHDEISAMIVSGDQVAVHFTARSTNGARPLALPIIAIIRVRDGRIVEDNAVFDTGGAPCEP